MTYRITDSDFSPAIHPDSSNDMPTDATLPENGSGPAPDELDAGNGNAAANKPAPAVPSEDDPAPVDAVDGSADAPATDYAEEFDGPAYEPEGDGNDAAPVDDQPEDDVSAWIEQTTPATPEEAAILDMLKKRPRNITPEKVAVVDEQIAAANEAQAERAAHEAKRKARKRSTPQGAFAALLQKYGLTEDDVLDAARTGDKGAAALFVAVNRGRFMYDCTAKEWMIFKNHRWNVDDGKLWMSDGPQDGGFAPVMALFKECAAAARRAKKNAYSDDPEKQEEAEKEYSKNAAKLDSAYMRLTSAAARRAASELASTADNLGEVSPPWDNEPNRLPVANGIIDLKTGALAEGNPTDRFSRGVNIAFAPAATCPRFEQFITEIFNGDAEKARYLQKWTGYAVTRNPRERIVLFLTGKKGSNGKSLFAETVCHVLTDEIAATIKAELLIDRHITESAKTPDASKLKLMGRGPAFTSELNKEVEFDAALLKHLTGNDTIAARAPYAKKEISFRPTHTIAVLCNDLPRLPANDSAVWDRVRVLDFPMKFLDPEDTEYDHNNPQHKPKDVTLKKTLEKEAAGILRWIVDGAVAYHREGLTPPDSVRGATSNYRKRLDDMGDFIDDCCVSEPCARVAVGTLYDAYKQWATENRIRYVGSKRFGEELLARGGYARGRTAESRMYVGIRLKEGGED